MNRFIIFLVSILFCSNAYADIVVMPQYGPNDTLTDTNLNLRWNNLTNEINGNLDNTNADVDGGFRFIEILGVLPAVGNQGRVVFNTANNTLNFDTGTSFLATALLANTQTFTGENTFNGTTNLYGTINKIGNGGTDTLELNLPSGITYTPTMTWTFTGNQTVSGTWANAGTMTTVDINGGTIDASTLGGSSQVTITDADMNGGTIDGVTLGTTNDVTLTDLALSETTAPDTAASEGKLYTKDVGGQPELYYREESNGDEVKITEDGEIVARSNVIFAWLGVDDAAQAAGDGGHGMYSAGVTVSPTSSTPTNLFLLRGNNTANNFLTFYGTIKWVKTPGVDTLTVYIRSWTTAGTATIRVNVNSGGVTEDIAFTSTTPTDQTAVTLDVSGLTNGTKYDIILQSANSSENQVQYVSSIFIFGS